MTTNPPSKQPHGSKSNSTRLLAGGVSGVVSALVFQPLDVLRTHQQGAFGSHSKPDLWHSLRKKRSWWALVQTLWRGTSPTLIRVAGGAGLYFASLEHLLAVLPAGPLSTFGSGAFARAFAGAVMSPFTVVKTKMEWQPAGTYRSNLHAVQNVVAQEGVGGLYRGMVPTLVRDVPFSGLYVLLYTNVKKLLEMELPEGAVPSYAIHFTSGIVAGVFATTIVHPADVVKTRMQLAIVHHPEEIISNRVKSAAAITQQERNVLSIRDTVRRIAHEEGIRGFCRGMTARVLKRTLSTALTWTIYEQFTTTSN